MRRLTAPKISCFYIQLWLSFLPAALRLWWPSFSPDWPSALNLFLFLFVLFFLFIFFIFHYFSFIFDYYSLGLIFKLFWSLSGPFVVSSLCLTASLSLSLICCTLWANCHPFASFGDSFLYPPVSPFIFFRGFQFVTAHAIHRMRGFFFLVIFYLKLFLQCQ